MNDNRNMILAIVLCAMVLIGWSLVSRQVLPDRRARRRPRSRTARSSRCPSRSADPAADAPQAIRDRAVVLRRNAAGRGSTRRSLQGSINLKGARIDDLVLITPARDHRQEFAAGPAALAGRHARTPISPSFGWTGEGVAAPDADTVWTAERAG